MISTYEGLDQPETSTFHLRFTLVNRLYQTISNDIKLYSAIQLL